MILLILPQQLSNLGVGFLWNRKQRIREMEIWQIGFCMSLPKLLCALKALCPGMRAPGLSSIPTEQNPTGWCVDKSGDLTHCHPSFSTQRFSNGIHPVLFIIMPCCVFMGIFVVFSCWLWCTLLVLVNWWFMRLNISNSHNSTTYGSGREMDSPVPSYTILYSLYHPSCPILSP